MSAKPSERTTPRSTLDPPSRSSVGRDVSRRERRPNVMRPGPYGIGYGTSRGPGTTRDRGIRTVPATDTSRRPDRVAGPPGCCVPEIARLHALSTSSFGRRRRTHPSPPTASRPLPSRTMLTGSGAVKAKQFAACPFWPGPVKHCVDWPLGPFCPFTSSWVVLRFQPWLTWNENTTSPPFRVGFVIPVVPQVGFIQKLFEPRGSAFKRQLPAIASFTVGLFGPLRATRSSMIPAPSCLSFCTHQGVGEVRLL